MSAEAVQKTELEALTEEVARRNRLERRMEVLLSVTGELAAARTRDEVGQIAIEKGLRALGASSAGIWVLDPVQRVLVLLAASPLPRGNSDGWQVLSLDIDAPIPHAVRTGEHVFLASLAEHDARFSASCPRTGDTSVSPHAAYAALALVADGPPVGAMAMTREGAQELDASERTYLAILARQCGLALERIQLHEAEIAARKAVEIAARKAEEATHAREEILSVVSHDLRNPLGTILIGASTLLQLADADDAKTQRVRTVATRIHRQSERMARQIQDLVDFAGIQAGGLAIERTSNAPEAILTMARELCGPLAIERGLQLELEIASELPAVACDADRVVQILASLITNALKVTPRGGRITIGVDRADDDDVIFFVRDTGPGIDADELPILFERFWRSKRSSYKGAGLGLSIARGIVEAHGGRIWARSDPGQGATFLFSLTSRHRRN